MHPSAERPWIWSCVCVCLSLGLHDWEKDDIALFLCDMKTISADDLNSSIWKEWIILEWQGDLVMNQICIESCKQINKYNSFFQVNLTVFRTGRVRLQIEIVYTCSHPVINRALLHTTVMLKTSVYSLIHTRSISLKKRSIIRLNDLRHKHTFVCYYIRLAKPGGETSDIL